MLRGATIEVGTRHGAVSDTWAYLLAVGTTPMFTADSDVLIPIGQMELLAGLPARVRVHAEGPAAALWALISHAPVNDVPAEVRTTSSGLEVSWFDGFEYRRRMLTDVAAEALLAIGVPFVADHSAWETIQKRSALPPRVATASMSPDGFINLFANAPQLLAAAPIPGLFRISDVQFGAPRIALPEVLQMSGVTWVGPQPLAPSAQLQAFTPTPEIPAGLSSDAAPLIAAAASKMLDTGGLVMVRPFRSQRRMLTAATISAVDGYPSVVVCPASSVWPWQRHFHMLGRSAAAADVVSTSTRTPIADVTVVPSSRPDLLAFIPAPVSLVVESAPDEVPDTRLTQFSRMYPDAFRALVLPSRPKDPQTFFELMQLVDPKAFSGTEPIERRYPTDPETSFAAHVQSYVFSDEMSSDPAFGSLRRFSTAPVQMPASLRRAIVDLASRDDLPVELRFSLVLEVQSSGSAARLSPKVAKAAELTLEEVADDRTVTVLTSSDASLRALRILLGSASEVSLATFEQFVLTPPDSALVRPDTLILLDYPLDVAVLDRMLGPDSQAPSLVLIVHALGSIDDIIAVLTARRPATAFTSDDMRMALESCVGDVDAVSDGGGLQ